MKTTLIFLTAMSLIACSSSKPIVSGLRPSQIQDLRYFDPFSFVALIEYENVARPNLMITRESENLAAEVVEDLRGELPITFSIQLPDDDFRQTFKEEVRLLCETAVRHKGKTPLKLPAAIDSLMDERGVRHALIVVSTGFTRAHGNYANEMGKAVGRALLLNIPGYITVPIKQNATVFAFVADAGQNNIAYFRRSSVEGDPLDKPNIRRLIDAVFKGYFWI